MYRKTGQEIVGFVDLGQVSNEMGDLEKSLSQLAVSQTPFNDVATHMLVLMIRGIVCLIFFLCSLCMTFGACRSVHMLRPSVHLCIVQYQFPNMASPGYDSGVPRLRGLLDDVQQAQQRHTLNFDLVESFLLR